ncbi:MAG: hypothetical protein A2287_05550 [Candidatus Melainabacteria bacterium RIFOXYA12_FULL_32_12]|nr:MAG: hypothetical protein A2255_04125 [Candidatus Melainabacteria bacterium RIFOXYA2_FULL_32_9]OGI30990.1 MAG: hypothetical protein A2287_05550 [Candidatus Melainabacteria bacterium RIFOXYA12_FULL_32_12]
MTISNFNPQEFGQSLAQQAQQVIPQDLTDEQKQYVVNKVYQFCILAGNALNQDPNINFDANQASIIVQFIGEWTFHKSIDAIRAGVPQDCWDQILQDVAFAIFEKAKNTQSAGIPQDQAISMVEQEVAASYEKSLRELIKSGKINEQDLTGVMAHSNIDQMAQSEQNNPQMSVDEEKKTIKYASIALLLKTLSDTKKDKILSALGSQEAEQIKMFMQIPDLESKVDPALIDQFLKDFKRNMSSIKRHIYSQSNNIMSLKEQFTELEIKKVVQFERKKIKDYVDYCLVDIPTAYIPVEFSSQVSSIITNYIKSKLPA